ncbi:MAG: YhbY family RNA-binding protein [Candidatus Poseidonia sp.]|nr:YhbY family RNA-binding protein [Poseidonia sp.]
MSKIPNHILVEAKSRELKPSVRIGKSGITPTVLGEINNQLRSRNIVKIKANKGLFERGQRSELWGFLSSETQSVLVLQRGNIGVLWRS